MDEYVAGWIATHRGSVQGRDAVFQVLTNNGIPGNLAIICADQLNAEGSGVVLIPESDLEAL